MGTYRCMSVCVFVCICLLLKNQHAVEVESGASLLIRFTFCPSPAVVLDRSLSFSEPQVPLPHRAVGRIKFLSTSSAWCYAINMTSHGNLTVSVFTIVLWERS